jgi:hypothetical protein
MSEKRKPACSTYRQEMMLLGLKRRLAHNDLSETEKYAIKAAIKELEQETQID